MMSLRRKGGSVSTLADSTPASVAPPKKGWIGQQLMLLGLLLVYTAILHWTYQWKIAPLFGYLGSRYRDPEVRNYLLAFGLAYIVAFFLPRRLCYPSDFVVWMLYVMACVPSILVPQYADILSASGSIKLASAVAANFWLLVVLADKGPKRIGQIRVPNHMIWNFLAVVTLAVYGYMLYVTGLSFRFISLAAVQDVRFAYRDAIAVSGPGLAYLIGVQGNVINPTLVARGIYGRRWFLVVAGATGQILIFSVTGYKLILLSVPAAFLVGLMFRFSARPRGYLVLAGTIISSLLALAADKFTGGFIYTQIFINRLLLIPGTLTAAHVLVFRGEAKAEWGHSFMAPFVDYPYEAAPAFIVGERFSGNAEVSSNTSLFGDGYANLGYPGILVEVVVLLLILWVVNGTASRLPIAVSSMILLVPTLALVNTSVFTSILTGGFAASVILMSVLPESGWGRFDRGSETRDRDRSGSQVAD